jgi:hypothetical protein
MANTGSVDPKANLTEGAFGALPAGVMKAGGSILTGLSKVMAPAALDMVKSMAGKIIQNKAAVESLQMNDYLKPGSSRMGLKNFW